ncbi:MAG: hypothetical protein AAF657_24990 [Acidobacteriota bacterium]
MLQTIKADPGQESGRDPGMTLVRSVLCLIAASWLGYVAIVEGFRFGAVDMNSPVEAEVFGSFEKKSFWKPQAWLLVTTPFSNGEHLRVDIRPEQYEAYRRGDVVRLFPLEGRKDFITDRELWPEEPLLRMGQFAFSWHPFAAVASAGFGLFYLVLGVLGVRRELASLDVRLFMLHEVLELLLIAAVGLALAAAAVASLWSSKHQGERFVGVTGSEVESLVVSDVAKLHRSFHRHRFFALGTTQAGNDVEKVGIDRSMFYGLRRGDEIFVVRCNGPSCLALPTEVQAVRPMINFLGVTFSWQVLLTPLFVCVAVVLALCLRMRASLLADFWVNWWALRQLEKRTMA